MTWHEQVMAAVVELLRGEQLDIYEIALRLVGSGYAQVETAVALVGLEQTGVIVIQRDNRAVLQ